MYTFHVTLFARPADVGIGDDVILSGRSVATLAVRADRLSTPFDVTFEQVEAALSALPRMFCEPDGSFVWRSTSDDRAWQVDGQLTDRTHRLLSVELRGTCPPSSFDTLLSTIGWPATPLIFQLARAGVHLSEVEFRRWAPLYRDSP